MIISDFVECDGCGAKIEHIGTQKTLLDANRNDVDYRLCESCITERDEEPTCKSQACAEHRCGDCADVDGNCCDCNCHLGL